MDREPQPRPAPGGPAAPARGDPFGGARAAWLTGLADAVTGLQRQEAAIRERIASASGGVASGAVASPPAAAPRSARGAAQREEPPRVAVEDGDALGEMLFDLVRLELRVLDQLLTMSLRNADRLVAYLQQTGEPLQKRTPVAAVRLAGRPGESPVARFVVDNTSLRAAEVALRVSDLEPEGGGPSFCGDMRLVPERAQIEANQAIEVEVRIALDRRFEPRRAYRAEVELAVTGRPKRTLPLRIEVGAAAPPRRPRKRKA